MADLYCTVDLPDQTTRLRRLLVQLSRFTDYDCSSYLPAARTSATAARDDRERMQVGTALASIARCYSLRDDCPTARQLLGEAQAFIPALALNELAPVCR
jgi:hypothetical protein